MIKEKHTELLWKKYSPKTLEDIILIPRVKELLDIKSGSNLVLYGHYGTGKSTVATALTSGKNVFYKNTRLNTGIEVVRDEITPFILRAGFDLVADVSAKKVVYLEEFEKASKDFQESLKALIDDYSHIVRFIFTTNHIGKVDGGVLSRCTSICFDPQNDEEERFLKSGQAKAIKRICLAENIDIADADIKSIVISNFPDMRSMIEILDVFTITNKLKVEGSGVSEMESNLFPKLISPKYNLIDIQNYVFSFFGDTRIHMLLRLLGRPLIEYIAKNKPDVLVTDKLGLIYNTVAEHTFWLNNYNNGDPLILGVSCLSKIHRILNS